VGYPGDADYREFYKDIGWELPLDALEGFLPGGARRNLGIKYHRVTGPVDLGAKELYDRRRALARAAHHAGHFLEERQRQLRRCAEGMDRPPIVVTPFDAELFGHWWYEGPDFLGALFRRLHAEPGGIEAVTPSGFLEKHPDCDVSQPPMSSWGAGGHAEVWLNPANDWIYPHLDAAARRMVELARRFTSPGGLERRALDQAARELLLAQSSDWAFMMKTGTTVEYATKRTRDHLARFDTICSALVGGGVGEPALREIEERDNIFPEIDYGVYR
jgi:1,4-alpha-glucan branching enzyme